MALRKSPERALERRHYVLGQMLAKGFITQELYDEVKDAPLRLAPAAETESELSPEYTAFARRATDAGTTADELRITTNYPSVPGSTP